MYAQLVAVIIVSYANCWAYTRGERKTILLRAKFSNIPLNFIYKNRMQRQHTFTYDEVESTLRQFYPTVNARGRVQIKD